MRHDMEKIYTDAEKIKRLSAWHESEKKEIAELQARITALETLAQDVVTAVNGSFRQKIAIAKLAALLTTEK